LLAQAEMMLQAPLFEHSCKEVAGISVAFV
jgi:hypothetical protein